jgi:hypothetical protein
MIEVFKTNITNRALSSEIINKLNEMFPGYQSNFDLEDCDNILRIDAGNENLNSETIIKLLHENGFAAETLPDEISIIQ